MIANLINTVIGLALTYLSILHPHLLEGQVWAMVGIAVVIFVLALWARRSDSYPWQSNTNLVIAVLLAGLGFLQVMPLPLVTFWGLFWAGLLVAVLSMWAMLYRPAVTELEKKP